MVAVQVPHLNESGSHAAGFLLSRIGMEQCRLRKRFSDLNTKARKTLMAKEAHTKAAEHHETAAKSHRTAAEHHSKGDHTKGREESGKAQTHSKNAHEHSETAHGKSQSVK
jgi:hypothetical protein